MKHFLITPPDAAPYTLALPCQWAEVTLSQYIRLLTEPDTSPLCCLSTLAPEQMAALPSQEVARLLGELSFLQDASDLLALLPTPNLPTVGESSYGRLLLATQYIEQQGDGPLLACAPYLVALYRSQPLSKEYGDAQTDAIAAALLASSLPSVWADVHFYLTDWLAFHERHAADGEAGDDYTDDELEAGMDEIDEQFGPFATLDALSGSDPTKYEQLLAIGAETMLTRIRLAQQQRRAQRRIFEMQQQPN